MRESFDLSFGDPLQGFETPSAVREIGRDMDVEFAKLQDRIRKISDASDTPIGDGPKITTEYIDERQKLVEDMDILLKATRDIIREVQGQSSPFKRHDLKRIFTEIEKRDGALLKERAALAAHRIRVEYGITGQLCNVNIGEAYLMAITDSFPKLEDASYEKMHRRSGTDQTSFRNRLIKAYNTDASDILDDRSTYAKEIWCPVSEKEFNTSYMTAAHIVPCSIGEENAAYLFGSGLSKGYEHIWSEKNGLMLNNIIETMLDNGEMAIIPDPTDENEFISIILSQDRLNSNIICPATDTPYRALHKKRLQFRTAVRPGKRYLYMHAMVTIFRRRRYNVPGWEKDRELVFSGNIWATPGRWARRSMIQALALEIGDIWPESKEEPDAKEAQDTKSPEDERKIATLVNYVWRSRASTAVLTADDTT